MVKYRAKPKGHETGQVITTKSPYGSHEDMVVELEELQESEFFETEEGRMLLLVGTALLTVCKDDRGYYVTFKSRLDNGLADPNRYADRRFQL